MRKLLLVLVSILLLTGVANAVEWTQAVTAEYAAQNTGRAVVTDNSVLLQIWYTGTETNPLVGVTSSSVMYIYSTTTGVTNINTVTATTDTIGEVVDTINGTAGWHAVVGPDSYKAMTARNALLRTVVGGVDIVTAPGATEASAVSIFADSSCPYNRAISCGVKADATARIRLKNINSQLASNLANITVSVYDGDTRIWRKTIASTSYVAPTAISASPNTIIPAGERGLSTTKGNSLCVVVSTDSQIIDRDLDARAIDGISITYDKLRD